jgi:hypothetical protein
MKIATFAALAVVTAAVIGGAYFATQERESGLAETFQATSLYPDLLGRVNDVTYLRIASQADGPLTMEKQGDLWGLAEKHGYPADFAKIRKTLVELASMEAIEPKTKKPENHADLAVEPVEAAEGVITHSIHVTAKAGDESLADLLVGRTRPKDVGAGVFVRKADENQVWLASGSYQPNRRVIQWLDRNILNIDSRRVVNVSLQHADGDSFTVGKQTVESEDMSFLSPVPEGKAPKATNEMNNMGNIMDFLILEDVRPVADLDWGGPDVVGLFHTYDGLLVTMAAVKDGKHTWLRLFAQQAKVDDRLAAFLTEHKGKDSEQGRIADQMKTADEVQAEADELNARLGKWAYRFTDYKSGRATVRSADLLKDAGAPG